MAYELTQKCIDLPALDMSAKEKLVLISLARFADDSGKCFPSLPTLERVTGMDIRTLRKSVAALDAGGWIEFEQEAGKRRFYTLKIERIEASLNADPSQKCTPCKNVPPTNLHPLQECTPTPCKNERGTPYKNAPRIKHIREQEENISFAPACACAHDERAEPDDSAMCPTVDDIPADVFGLDPDISDPPAELPPAKEKEKPAKKKRGYRCEVERPADVDPQLWVDFLKNRQTKRCPVTQTLLRRYAEKGKLCGMSLSQVLTTIIERNWQGFEPDWLRKEQEGRACFKSTPERTAAPSYFSVTKPVPQRVDDDGAHELFKGLLA